MNKKNKNTKKNKIQQYNYKEISLTKMAKHQLYVTLFSILGVTLATLGSAYAIFTSTSRSNDYNVVKAGSLNIDFGSDSSNVIDLSGKYPMSDSEGEALTPYTFTITNTGTLPADYEIRLQDDTDMITQDGCSTNQLNKNYIKYKVNDENANVLASSDRLLAEGSLAKGESATYNLHVWIKDGVGNDALNKHYHGKIVVKGVNQIGESLALKLQTALSGSLDTSDSEQTFIKGTDPNNYIWYSGKLWRAISIDPTDNSIKIMTDDAITAIPYSSTIRVFKDSHMEKWLNDDTVDGFLGNLRDYSNFIKTDSTWNATLTGSESKPAKTTMVTDPVGLISTYEYNQIGTTSYLNSFSKWLLTPQTTSNFWRTMANGTLSNDYRYNVQGVKPVVNLKSTVKTIAGTGTKTDPYRLKGDNDTSLSGVKLNTRYSGEYISFGKGENNLYRIVSHEVTNKTKIVSATPLKDSGSYKTMAFGSNTTYSSTNTIGTFLNGSYLTDYLNTSDVNMIEDSTTWYLGNVGNGGSYKLGKYTSDTSTSVTSKKATAKVGLLRMGELMSGQTSSGNASYWTLSPYDSSTMRFVDSTCGDTASGAMYKSPSTTYAIKPAMVLKENVVITGGTGTKEDPFTIKLGS